MHESSIEHEVRAIANRIPTQDGQHFYALVDGALQRSTLKRSRAFALPHSIVPAGGVVARSDLSALPFLVELTAPESREGHRFVADLAAWALDYAAVTWLESRLPIASLAEQLALRLEAELPQGLAVVLRFADARVLPVVHDTLDAEQHSRFFCCVRNWWYVSREGELRALAIRRESSAQPVFEPPLKLTALQENQLVDAAEPDAVMQILRRHDAQALDKVAPSQQYDFIKASIGRARTWSVETPSDLALFCMLALAQGPAFDELTNWTAALTPVRAGAMTLIRAVQQQGPPA